MIGAKPPGFGMVSKSQEVPLVQMKYYTQEQKSTYVWLV